MQDHLDFSCETSSLHTFQVFRRSDKVRRGSSNSLFSILTSNTPSLM